MDDARTDPEKTILATLFATGASDADIAASLPGRSASAVANKRISMGLRREPPHKWTDAKLREVLKVPPRKR